MYTLKIRWTRHAWKELDPPGTSISSLEDETTLFIPADSVRVHGHIPAGKRADVMKHWHESDGSHCAPGYLNYLSVTDNGDVGDEEPGRLICVVRDGEESWYTATHAWILGPDGGTIERVAP